MAYLILCKTTGFGTLDPVILRTFPTGTIFMANDKDSSNNVFVAGYSNAEGAADLITLKYNQGGSLEWQRIIGSAAEHENGYCVTTDSSGNTIVGGRADNSEHGSNDLLVVKYNSSGSIQWQRVIGGTGNDSMNGVATDASDNIYITGNTTSDGPGSTSIMLMKLNSSGIIQWQRSFGGTSSEYGNTIMVSGNDVYVAGYGYKASGSFGSHDFIIVKYDTSGTYQWQRNIGGSDVDYIRDISIDSSGNIYVVGDSESVPGSVGRGTAVIVKCNSSGIIQWQRALQSPYRSYFSGVAVDDNDNIYSVGRYSTASVNNYHMLIAKYNTSGTLQWQRKVDGGSTIMNGRAITAVGNHVVISGNNVNDGFIMYLQNDGTGTGTYGIFTYDSVSLTETNNPVFSEGDIGYTDEEILLSEQAGAFTNAVSTFTETNHS